MFAVFNVFKTICLICTAIFLILRFFFGESMNGWYEKNMAACIAVRTFGILAIAGIIFFMADVALGKVM